MANGEDKTSSKDFYGVLGLKKECSASELRNAYKKLALRWHPDRCSASGNTKYVEEAKNKFQAIQQAYSVLSDDNKRFLYDVGLYDSEDEDEDGMGDFMNEMVAMMSQTKPNENEEENFSELQELFEDMFQEDIGSFGTTFQTSTSCSSSSSCASYNESPNSNNKRVSSDENSGKTKVEGSSGVESHFQKFCLGVEHQQEFKRGKGVRGGVQVQGGGSGSSSSSSSRWKHQARQKTKGLIRNMDVSSN